MYINDFLNQFKDKKIKLFVDMDGVIADYNVEEAYNYQEKRPLLTSISKLEDISKMDNIELFILSISRMDEGIEQKNSWLDKYAPFFKRENRIIISRESNNFMKSSSLKASFVKNIERDGKVLIVIDDDPRVIKEIQETSKDVILLKDTALVD